MKNIALIFLLIWGITTHAYSQSESNVLIFTKTTGFRHASIPKGVKVLRHLLDSNKVKSFHTEDSNYFNEDTLKKFDAIIFLSTTGDILDGQQKLAFQNFIRSGKGFVGVHAASDTEFNWPWYGALVGCYFVSHPTVQEAKIDVINTDHQSTSHLQRVWFHKDEWYDFRNIKPGLNILMKIDETSYKGGKMGKFHPIAWFQEYEGGRSFYTGLGHTEESYDSSDFQKHLLGGIKYAIGK